MSTSSRLRQASRLPLAALAGGLAVATVIAAHAPEAEPSAGCARGAVSRLYLGQNTPAGVLNETDWRRFVEETVAPRFPAGFTELHGHGHWRDARGTRSEEATRIVEIAHDDSAAMRTRIRAIATDYRVRFGQEAVLVTTIRADQCFEAGG